MLCDLWKLRLADKFAREVIVLLARRRDSKFKTTKCCWWSADGPGAFNASGYGSCTVCVCASRRILFLVLFGGVKGANGGLEGSIGLSNCSIGF